MDAQIKKGILEMCLLYKLSLKDYYGYNLMKEMKVLYPEVSDSTFYAILRRIYKEGNATIYLGNESGGPVRKYYKLTEKGYDTLQMEMQEWLRIKDIVESLGIRN